MAKCSSFNCPTAGHLYLPRQFHCDLSGHEVRYRLWLQKNKCAKVNRIYNLLVCIAISRTHQVIGVVYLSIFVIDQTAPSRNVLLNGRREEFLSVHVVQVSRIGMLPEQSAVKGTATRCSESFITLIQKSVCTGSSLSEFCQVKFPPRRFIVVT